MIDLEVVTENSFITYAMRNYNNPHCTDVFEFQEDLNKIKYLKRLFKKYEKVGDLRERHIINHLVILYNVFKPRACTKMLLLKLEEYHHYLKPFLLYLGYWPNNNIYGVGDKGTIIYVNDVTLDEKIITVLREMEKERIGHN